MPEKLVLSSHMTPSPDIVASSFWLSKSTLAFVLLTLGNFVSYLNWIPERDIFN